MGPVSLYFVKIFTLHGTDIHFYVVKPSFSLRLRNQHKLLKANLEKELKKYWCLNAKCSEKCLNVKIMA
jgi:hypothetical protein